MKKLAIFGFLLAMAVFAVPTTEVEAQYSYNPYYQYQTTATPSTYTFSGSEEELVAQLLQLIAELQAELNRRQGGGYFDYDHYYYDDDYRYGRGYYVGRPRSGGSSNDDEPDVKTEDADDIDDDRAELNGEVDMNDFRNGVVFFVYGEDEDQIEDVEDDFDSYSDVDEDGDDLQKVRVDSDLDGDESYSRDVTGLDDDTDYYYQICVEYEDEDDDETLECGGVEEFETDRNGGSSNDDEPDVSTDSATNIEDDSAKLRGEVDMNDFNNGVVFFVYGEDEDQIEDVENDFDSYNDVDEDGDDLQKGKVDNDLDGRASYTAIASSLDEDTRYYFQICVEYEDDDDDDTLECGGVEDFRTDD